MSTEHPGGEVATEVKILEIEISHIPRYTTIKRNPESLFVAKDKRRVALL